MLHNEEQILCESPKISKFYSEDGPKCVKKLYSYQTPMAHAPRIDTVMTVIAREQ